MYQSFDGFSQDPAIARIFELVSAHWPVMVKTPSSDSAPSKDEAEEAEAIKDDGYDDREFDDAKLAVDLGVQVNALPVEQVVPESQIPPDSFTDTLVVGGEEKPENPPETSGPDDPTIEYLVDSQLPAPTELDPETPPKEPVLSPTVLEETPADPESMSQQVSEFTSKEPSEPKDVQGTHEEKEKPAEKLSLSDVRAQIQALEYLGFEWF